MRRRVKRDLTVLFGILVVLVVVAFANSQFERSNLANRMEQYRQRVESDRESGGLDLLSWNLLRKTTGSMREGPTFHEALLEMDGQHVDIVGFMVPLDEFRNVREFLLLPLPIVCYFCEEPPMRDVMVVQMAEGHATEIYQEPVLINGDLTLNQEPNTKFFYVISNAKMGPGKKGGSLTRKNIPQQHMMHGSQTPESELLPPTEPPVEAPSEELE